MAKWGTYSIVISLLAMLLPFILEAFNATHISSSPLFPLTALIFGGLGVVIHLISALKTDALNGSALLLLTSVLAIIFGFSLSSLGLPNAKHLLLAGALLVAFWIMLPSKKQEE